MDPNRDWMTLSLKELRWYVKLMSEFKPHLIIDMHEARPRGNTYLMISYPNITPTSRTSKGSRKAEVIAKALGVKPSYLTPTIPVEEKGFYKEVLRDLKEALPHAHVKRYFVKKKKSTYTGGYPTCRLLRNYASLRGSMAVLIETTKDKPLSYRVSLQEEALKAILEHANPNLDLLRAIVEEKRGVWAERFEDTCVVAEDVPGIKEKLREHGIGFAELEVGGEATAFEVTGYKAVLKYYVPEYELDLRTKRVTLEAKNRIVIPLWTPEGGLALRLTLPYGTGDSLLELRAVGFQAKLRKALPVYIMGNCRRMLLEGLKDYQMELLKGVLEEGAKKNSGREG